MRTLIFLFFIICQYSALFAANIGVLVMATGKYVSFVPSLLMSAEAYFCRNHKVTYFIFTDGEPSPRENMQVVYQKKLGWPYDSMMRFEVYSRNWQLFQNCDYLFAMDVDMLFVDEVGDEILGDRVATLHPGFVGRRGTYEGSNPASLAYVRPDEGYYYFCGGFLGGSRTEFLRAADTISRNIRRDLEKQFIAVWHDESHWNRYCIDHQPTLILSPSYCYPEDWQLPYQRKLLALNKNHNEMRK